MPWGASSGARLLREHVIVVEAHGTALHQLPCNMGEVRAAGDATIVWIVLPIAKVFDKEARVVWSTRNDRARARRGEIGFDATRQSGELLAVQKATQAHCTITLVGLDDVGSRCSSNALLHERKRICSLEPGALTSESEAQPKAEGGELLTAGGRRRQGGAPGE